MKMIIIYPQEKKEPVTYFCSDSIYKKLTTFLRYNETLVSRDGKYDYVYYSHGDAYVWSGILLELDMPLTRHTVRQIKKGGTLSE